jgi:1-acyl-sn-glycerol-3-phosphate acyltransferase
MLLHLLVGTPPTVLCQTAAGRAIHIGDRPLSEVMSRWWAAVICWIFGLRVRVEGTFPAGPQLVAANHISWIDIQLLHCVSPVSFVAKAEIGEWPLVGWLARAGGTVFHRRGSHDSASGVATAMAKRLEEGRKIVVFAEGGILPGHGVKRFHARLFAAAIESGTPVLPVMLRYVRDGRRCDDITFLEDENFVVNFFRLMMQKPCIAEVHALPVIDPQGKQRRELAGEAEAAVRAAFESELLHLKSR